MPVLYPLISEAARDVWKKIVDDLKDRSIYDPDAFDRDLAKEINETQIDTIYDALVEAFESGSRST